MPKNKAGKASRADRFEVKMPKFSVKVKGAMGKVTTIAKFLAEKGTLTLNQQTQIVRQAQVILQNIYVHLPQKRAMHAVDPVQRLRLLEYRLTVPTPGLNSRGPLEPMDERRFHNEMSSILTSLRDLHTVYTLPEPFQSHVAFLPFTLEEYFDGQNSARCNYTARLVDGLKLPPFTTGAIIKYWNGMPIERAVELNADRTAGSNPWARHARGLETMTLRAMATSPPPDEEWVELRFETNTGKVGTIRLPWLVLPIPNPAKNGAGGKGASVRALGIDLQGEILRRAKVVLLKPDVARREQKMKEAADRYSVSIDPKTESFFPDLISFRRVGPSQRFGYLRIFSFMPPSKVSVTEFVNEVKRIVELLPQEGLIIDVRGNGGGVISAGESLLQMFTSRKITPEPLQFVNTPLTRKLAEHFADTKKWSDSIAQAVLTGAAFSQGFPAESEEQVNKIGRIYNGRVLLITDARCYSTTDIFVAGFQDHEIGTILGVDENTGAGGANLWSLSSLRQALPDDFPTRWPNGADMTLAVRRTTRVGKMSGVPVEDLGVRPDKRWKMTRNDVFHENMDLINHAVKILQGR